MWEVKWMQECNGLYIQENTGARIHNFFSVCYTIVWNTGSSPVLWDLDPGQLTYSSTVIVYVWV